MQAQQMVKLRRQVGCIAGHQIIRIEYKYSEIYNRIVLGRYDTITAQTGLMYIEGMFPRYLFNPSFSYNTISHSIFVFGGVTGQNQEINEIYRIDLDSMQSTIIDPTGLVRPQARHGHSSYLYHHYLFIFGGINMRGMLNDLWVFNFQNLEWKELYVFGEIQKRHYCSLAMKDNELYILAGFGAQNYHKEVCHGWIQENFINNLIKIDLNPYFKYGKTKDLEYKIVAEFPDKVVIFPDAKLCFHNEDIYIISSNQITQYKEVTSYRMQLKQNKTNQNEWIYYSHNFPFFTTLGYPYFINNCVVIVNNDIERNQMCTRFEDLKQENITESCGPKIDVCSYMNIDEDRFQIRRGNRNRYNYCLGEIIQDPFKIVKLDFKSYHEYKYFALSQENFERLVQEICHCLNEPPVTLEFPLRDVHFAKQPLIACSKYFQKIFEIDPECVKIDMKINERTKDMDLKMLKLFYVFVHSQKVVFQEKMSLEQIKIILSLAEYYQMEDLFRGCKQYILDNAMLQDKIFLLQYSIDTKLNELQDALSLSLLEKLQSITWLQVLLSYKGFPSLLSKTYKSNVYYLSYINPNSRGTMNKYLKDYIE